MWLGLIFSRSFWVALAALFVAGYVFHLGNKYGSNARAYAAVVAELRATNAKLETLEKQDAAEVPEEDRARETAAAEASTVVSCKASKEVVSAINSVGE